MTIPPVLLCALLATACHEQASEPVEPNAAIQAARTETEFADTDELMHAIEEGNYAERVDLGELIDETTVPPAVSIAFESGSAIPDDQDFALRKLAKRLEVNDAKLVIVGCSDLSGPEAVNLRISLSRAEAVAERLEELGVRASRFQELIGLGEGCRFARRVVHVVPTLRADTLVVDRLRADETEPKDETQIAGE